MPKNFDFAIRISIHAPREGSDSSFLSDALSGKIFQSTLPVRGATLRTSFAPKAKTISIHAPREGSDGLLKLLCLFLMAFQSTLPVRGATPNIIRLTLNRKHFNPRSP